jgi:malonate-semialdehyde dehydrogenase (acetylating)/methylmalonate-semialdehyde dehydrogenase
VGSTPVARYIYETGTRAGKRVQALGGAKNHMVVMPDADLDQAAEAAINAGYGSAGERCMAISVVVAVGEAGDPLVARIHDRIGKITVGDGLQAGNEMGPLITREHRDKVAGYVGQGRDEGAKLVVDGRGLSIAGRENGFFLGPSLLDHVEPGMSVYRDEIFGPVLSVVRAENYEEARDLINTNSTPTASPSSPVPVPPRAGSSTRSKWGWWESTSRFRCRWPTTRSAAGGIHSSETLTSTAKKASASIHGPKW